MRGVYSPAQANEQHPFRLRFVLRCQLLRTLEDLRSALCKSEVGLNDVRIAQAVEQVAEAVAHPAQLCLVVNKGYPMLVAYHQVDFEVLLAVGAESVVGMDQVAGIVEVGLAFLPKVLPVLVVYRRMDFEALTAVEAESVVGMDQAAAVEWIAAE